MLVICSLSQVGRLENAIGWYHSHPGYGCWLSGIDVSTQMLNQQFQEPFVAVVVRHKIVYKLLIICGLNAVFQKAAIQPGLYEVIHLIIPLSCGKTRDPGIQGRKSPSHLTFPANCEKALLLNLFKKIIIIN